MAITYSESRDTRGRVTDAVKRETVAQILRGDVSLADAARRHGVQSYQLHAWIGYIALRFPETVRDSIDRRFPSVSLAAAKPQDNGDNAKAMAAEIITEVLTNLLGRKQ